MHVVGSEVGSIRVLVDKNHPGALHPVKEATKSHQTTPLSPEELFKISFMGIRVSFASGVVDRQLDHGLIRHLIE